MKDGKEVLNKDLIIEALKIKRTYNVVLLKVRAHTSKEDIHAKNNEIVDKLAKDGAYKNTHNNTSSNIFEKRIEKYQEEDYFDKLEDYATLPTEINIGFEDEDDDNETQEKIDELTERIEEMESEITDIEEDPSGDFPEDMITAKIDDLVSDVKYDPEEFMESFGLNWEDYIDKDDFIQGVIDADGYGHTINTYDGNADEIYVQDKLFYVIRID